MATLLGRSKKGGQINNLRPNTYPLASNWWKSVQ